MARTSFLALPIRIVQVSRVASTASELWVRKSRISVRTRDRVLLASAKRPNPNKKQRATESFDRSKDLLFHYSLSISDIGMMFAGTLDLQNSAFTGSLEDLFSGPPPGLSSKGLEG
jgi:hypothetical protein